MTSRRVLDALRPQDRALLARLTEKAGGRLALVGGAVRDALLGGHPLDLDVVLEGASVEVSARNSGLPFVYHPRYDNATLTLPDGRHFDVVRARAETYPYPGASPEVRPGSLREDLARRDFTVNALALDLENGELLDPFGGRNDLAAKTLRPLHPHSFRDDASRLARGARLAARLGFDLHEEGRAQVPDALRFGPDTPRLRLELPLIFGEARPGAVFARLRDWGAENLFGEDATASLARLDDLRGDGAEVSPTVYAAAWLAAQPEPREAAQAHHLGEKPLGLLERARSDKAFPPTAPETQLRRGLKLPEPAPRLSGADVLALGAALGKTLPGKQVGEVLAYLAALRNEGRVRSRDQEFIAVMAYLNGERI